MNKNCINKIGSDHIFNSKNNQDYYLICEGNQTNYNIVKLKMVLDGCGSGENSEVGVQLFSQLFNEIPDEQKLDPTLFETNVDLVMKKLLEINQSILFIYNNLCFTILCIFELEDKFIAKICGDGYLIVIKDTDIDYRSFENGEYPKYYLYNYIDEKYRGKYTTGVTFDTYEFLKTEYTNIGAATDGLKYMFEISDIEKNMLKELLIDRKLGKIRMLINRNHSKFKDDITICI